MTTEEDTFNKLRRIPGDAMLTMLAAHHVSSNTTISWPKYLSTTIDYRVIEERNKLLKDNGWTQYQLLAEHIFA
jgi:hypothetical protein